MKLLRFFFDATREFVYEAAFFLRNAMRGIICLYEVLLPVGCVYLGQLSVVQRGSVAAGGEYLVPIAGCIILYYMKYLAKRTNSGDDLPVPAERFTSVSDDGEVSVDKSRLPEMLLYVGEVEDYLERKGRL